MKISELLRLSISQIKNLPDDEKVDALEKLVNYHNKQYFIENSPVIPDPEFDEITELLRSLKPDSTVLYELVGETGDVIHPTPMLSIDKKYSYEDVKKWVVDVNDDTYLVEPKYDGMAARYQGGVLATRGNGRVGEDISERFQHLNIKGTLPKDDTSSVYGEVIIPTIFFDENLAEEYKNPRNAVVGIVKAKKISPAGIKALQDGGVHFVIHDAINVQKVSKDDLLNKEQWESILEEAFHSEYPLDGVVIKATNESIKESLGSTAHHDKWQIAYKVPAEKKWSEVVNIVDSVGRTGRITSIANIKPINLSGATVTNVTLHNFDFVEKSKIGVGSKVEVMRSGEVIPFITQVEASKNPHKEPKNCPVCGKPVKKYGKYLECINNECPAQVSLSIEYFFKTLDVEELGLKTIEKFIEVFDLKTVIDFYNLEPSEISPLEGFGEKSANKIVNNIQSTLSEKVTPSQLLQALGIKEIGPSTSRWIIGEYGFENLPKLNIDDLSNVKGIGPQKAKSFVESLKNKWWIVEDLKKKGLSFKKEEKTNKLEGLTFAITGKKETYSRDELIEMINKNGGEYKSSIVKGLDYLIAGEDAGSKLDKATGVGAKVISESDFIDLISKN